MVCQREQTQRELTLVMREYPCVDHFLNENIHTEKAQVIPGRCQVLITLTSYLPLSDGLAQKYQKSSNPRPPPWDAGRMKYIGNMKCFQTYKVLFHEEE